MKRKNRYETAVRLLKNKYFITLLLFTVWMAFFDRNDFYTRYSYHKELQKLEEEREYYLREIELTQRKQHELMSNPTNLEKFAREEYLMKKENEDIFLVLRDQSN
jgi:cell division protein FtsB